MSRNAEIQTEIIRRVLLWLLRDLYVDHATRIGGPMARDTVKLKALADDTPIEDLVAAANARLPHGSQVVAMRVFAAVSNIRHRDREYRGNASMQHAIAAVNEYRDINEVDRSAELGSVMLEAWKDAGGDVNRLLSPGVTGRIVQRIRKRPKLLDMDDYHSDCGTAHCIAGWYAFETGVDRLEKEFGTLPLAILVFAANHPGEPLPYMGTDQAAGRRELRRLGKLAGV